jgi:predicted DNA-binding transcriptional regulator AlpA
MENLLLKKLQEIKTLSVIATKEALSTKEAALFTGLSNSHISKLASMRLIPFYKARNGGKLNFFSKIELAEWMLSRKVRMTEELAEEAANYCVAGKRNGTTVRQKFDGISDNKNIINNKKK